MARLLETIRGGDVESALLRAACDELRKLPKESLAPVKIETARPLSADGRAKIEALLDGVTPAAVYHVDEELGGGVRIWTGQGMIDASVIGLSRYAEQALKQEMGNHTAPTKSGLKPNEAHE